jgi:hypothetical protein
LFFLFVSKQNVRFAFSFPYSLEDAGVDAGNAVLQELARGRLMSFRTACHLLGAGSAEALLRQGIIEVRAPGATVDLAAPYMRRAILAAGECMESS